MMRLAEASPAFVNLHGECRLTPRLRDGLATCLQKAIEQSIDTLRSRVQGALGGLANEVLQLGKY
jgi:hypothetical protein